MMISFGLDEFHAPEGMSVIFHNAPGDGHKKR
jgi:hypothetical protein